MIHLLQISEQYIWLAVGCLSWGALSSIAPSLAANTWVEVRHPGQQRHASHAIFHSFQLTMYMSGLHSLWPKSLKCNAFVGYSLNVWTHFDLNFGPETWQGPSFKVLQCKCSPSNFDRLLRWFSLAWCHTEILCDCNIAGCRPGSWPRNSNTGLW